MHKPGRNDGVVFNIVIMYNPDMKQTLNSGG